MRTPRMMATSWASGLLVAGCLLDSQEAERVPVPVAVSSEPLAVGITDLGYEVELSAARFVVDDLQFTTQGEQSAYGSEGVIARLLVPIRTAHAHPGHLEGGEIIGELPGRHIVDFDRAGAGIGTATMLTATYDSLNFTFGRATDGDGLASDDPLVGHSVVLEGTASSAAGVFPFAVAVDQDEGRQMIGGPFQARVRIDTAGPVELSLVLDDPDAGDDIFDGVDFAALAELDASSSSADGDGVLRIAVSGEWASGEAAFVAAHNRIRNALQRHPHYAAVLAD